MNKQRECPAPAEYMVRPPMPPLYFFLIDVSANATKSGMLETQLGGKLLIFQNTLPSGRLRLRGDHICVYGTDKENSLRIAEDPFYKQMAADFTKYQVATNVYAFSEKYSLVQLH